MRATVASVRGKWARRSREEWRSLLSNFERSGLGVDAYCRRESIGASSFYRWREVLRADQDADDSGTVLGRGQAFVELGALGSPLAQDKASHCGCAAPRLDLRLDLGDGLTLHLVRG